MSQGLTCAQAALIGAIESGESCFPHTSGTIRTIHLEEMSGSVYSMIFATRKNGRGRGRWIDEEEIVKAGRRPGDGSTYFGTGRVTACDAAIARQTLRESPSAQKQTGVGGT